MKEVELQQYIWDNRMHWQELLLPLEMEIVNDDYVLNIEDETFEQDGKTFTLNSKNYFIEPGPTNVFTSLIQRQIKIYYEHVKDIYFLGKEVRFEKDKKSTIRADFLAGSSGRTGFTIIELKINSAQEREALTELVAYGNHLQTIFPGLGPDNIFYLLIAPLEKRIVRESIINMLLFQEKDVFALQPIQQNDNTWKFKPWAPTFNDLELYFNDLFAEKNFDIVKIHWEEIPGHWNAEKGDNDNEPYIDMMNRVSSYCAQLMEARQISGFVYTSQAPAAWRKIGSNLINSLVIVGINPFKAQQNDGKTLIDLIPDLDKHRKENSGLLYILEGLDINWSNNLMAVGQEAIRFMTTNLDGKDYPVKMTTLSWDQHFHSLIEYGINANYRVFSTGFLRKIYSEFLQIDYKYIQKYGYEEHLYWNHGDIPEFIAGHFNSHNAFLDFLGRLHKPYRDYIDYPDDVNEEE